MKKIKQALLLGALTLCGTSAVFYKRNVRMPLKEYTRFALQMAVLDDEICRNELEGNRIGGEAIVFPPKTDSVPYRYHLFLNMNRKKSRRCLQSEMAAMEKRLEESLQFRDMPKTDLDITFKASGLRKGNQETP